MPYLVDFLLLVLARTKLEGVKNKEKDDVEEEKKKLQLQVEDLKEQMTRLNKELSKSNPNLIL